MNTSKYYLMYLRKSRSDDPNETVEEVLAKHERILQNYALVTFEHRIPEENIYREVVSGETIEDRSEIKRLFERMQETRCKGVLVVEPQRLSRGDLIDCGTVMQAFKYTKTLVVTPTKTFDLSQKYDYKAMQNELMQGAEYLEYIKEILTRGRKQAVLDGNYLPSTTPYGYDKVKEGKRQYLVVNREEAPIVQMMFEMYAQGHGSHTICLKLEEIGATPKRAKYFSDETVLNMLSNEVYLGHIVWNRHITERVFEDGHLKKKRVKQEKPIVIQNTHEPIITQELFDKVQSVRGKQSHVQPKRVAKNPFVGLLRCKKCGSVMTRNTYSHGRYPRYQCRNKRGCTNMSTNAKPLENAVVEALKIYLDDFKIKVESTDDSILKSHMEIVKNLEKKAADVEEKQEKLYDFLEQGIYDAQTFQDRNARLAKEREELKEALKVAKDNIPDTSYYMDRYTTLHNAIESLKDPDVPALTKNAFLKDIIEVIYYEKDEPDKTNPNHRVEESENIKLEIVLK